MSTSKLAFALNHMACPALSPFELIDAAKSLKIKAIELRNDVRHNSIADIETAKKIAQASQAAGIEVLSINALYPFNIWNPMRAEQAEKLAQLAQAAGAKALVCCPLNDGDYKASASEKAAGLRIALAGLKKILVKYNLKGHIEPLGFPISSLQFKDDAIKAIKDLNADDCFSLVHDTFHHKGANEQVMFPLDTGLVHISGVEDKELSFTDMLDKDRLFVGPNDRLDNIGQIKALLEGGYQGYISFEPFFDGLWDLTDPVNDIKVSMDYIRQQLQG
ncbi:MAG: TIM barrel protein [Colwellia sp.]|nr:TIM barrel protein [Colwellia sp.]